MASASTGSSPHGSASTASPKAQEQIQSLINHVYQQPNNSSSNMKIIQLNLSPPSPHKSYIITTEDQSRFLLKTKAPESATVLRWENELSALEAPVLEVINKCSNLSPKLIASSLSHPNHPMSGAFLLRAHIGGDCLARVAHRFTTFDREQIDRSIGSVIRSITTSRAVSFGLPTPVSLGKGFGTWKEAFQNLLSDALQDAEDSRLTLPYESIRYYVNYHMRMLEAVTEPRLVPLRAGMPETVFVDLSTKAIVGIVGWSDMIWGDPILAAVLEDPSKAFWSGFGSPSGLGASMDGVEIRKEM
jgi:hypothetical protein